MSYLCVPSRCHVAVRSIVRLALSCLHSTSFVRSCFAFTTSDRRPRVTSGRQTYWAQRFVIFFARMNADGAPNQNINALSRRPTLGHRPHALVNEVVEYLKTNGGNTPNNNKAVEAMWGIQPITAKRWLKNDNVQERRVAAKLTTAPARSPRASVRAGKGTDDEQLSRKNLVCL